MRSAELRSITIACLALVVVAGSAPGQQEPPGAVARATRQPGIEDLRKWKQIVAPAISPNGQWFSYSLASESGERETILRRLSDGREFSFPAGAGENHSALPVIFSDDGKSAVFHESPSAEERARLSRENRPVGSSASLVSLSTGEVTRLGAARSVAFNGRLGTWLALHLEGPAEGSELVLLEISTGTRKPIPNVSHFAFDSTGRRLLFVVRGVGAPQGGSAVVLRDMVTGLDKRLDESTGTYSHLAWQDADGGLLSVVKVASAASARDSTVEFIWFTGFARNAPRKRSYMPLADAAFPAGMELVRERAPTFTEDRTGVYFSVRAREGRQAPAPVPARGGVVVWQTTDQRARRHYEQEDAQARRAGYLVLFRTEEKRFIQLEDSAYRDVTITPRDRWALVLDRRDDAQLDTPRARRRVDVYAVDLRTGQRRALLTGTRNLGSPSPDGQRFWFFSDGHYFVYELGSGQTRNITEKTPVSFAVDGVNTGPSGARGPAHPVFGWAADSRSLIISDGWDVWNVPVSGARAVNLTVNGRKDSVRYTQRLFGGANENGIDLRKPLFLKAVGAWSRREGVARVEPGKPGATTRLWDDAKIEISRARDVDVYFYSRQTATDFPDYFIATASLGEGARVTRANPQQAEFAWSSGARLVDYTRASGGRLQAALHLPAGYEEGKSYPAVVYVGEASARGVNTYTNDGAGVPFNIALYTGRGYAVLMPEIASTRNDPGVSAVECITAAVQAAARTGVVDTTRLGIYGSNWGGYIATFTVTKSRMFAAAAASAPMTNLLRLASSQLSSGETATLVSSIRSHFSAEFWDSAAVFVRNSPLFSAGAVESPLLLQHNEEDELVDFSQSVDFFNSLRRLGKKVVLLQYPGEKNTLRTAANQDDFSLRMLEFFDHHLKSASAPQWWRDSALR